MDRRDIVVYRQWEDGFVVRNMTRQDVRIVQKWYNTICPTSTDLDIALDVFDPSEKFFFIGELHGEVVASLVNVPVCDGGLQYLSYLYVVDKYRKFGFARRIMDVDSEARGVESPIVSLDTHSELEEMQKRRGLQSAFKVTLYEGEVRQSSTTAGIEMNSRSGTMIKELDQCSWELILDYDDLCFIRPGSQYRRKLLKKWTAIPRGKTVAAAAAAADARQSGGVDGGEAAANQCRLVGFGCRRPSFQEGNHLIGPLYADSIDIAKDIVDALTQDIKGQNIWMSICENNAEAVRLVKELKMKDNIHMVRMYQNGDPGPLSDRVFAVTSIDICGF